MSECIEILQTCESLINAAKIANNNRPKHHVTVVGWGLWSILSTFYKQISYIGPDTCLSEKFELTDKTHMLVSIEVLDLFLQMKCFFCIFKIKTVFRTLRMWTDYLAYANGTDY